MGNRAWNVRATQAAVVIAVSACMSSALSAQSIAVGMRAETMVRVTVDVERVSLKSALQTIARQAGLRLFGGKEVLDERASVSLHLRDVPVDEAFAKALSGTGLQAEISRGSVALVPVDEREATAQGIVSGKVIDANTKQPLRGALVTLDESKKGSTSSNDGTFRLTNVAAGSHVLRVRLVGYARMSKTITVPDGDAVTVEVAMSSSVNTLEDVVVTGTVIPTELKAVPNAITIITAKQLEERGVTRIDELFRGDVPGLFVSRAGQNSLHNPGETGVVSRGSTKMYAGTASGGMLGGEGMKTYIDGIEMANPNYLGLIDPSSIERIEILTGPQASTIYGSNAINGVIQIFTKRGTTARPHVELSLDNTWTQNNFSSALAPSHNVTASVSGVEGQMSYSAEGAWRSTGSWDASVHETSLSGSGGAQWRHGPFSANLSLWQNQAKNHGNSDGRSVFNNNVDGVYTVVGGVAPHEDNQLNTDNGQGLSVTATPWSWWSHTLQVGFDELVQLFQINTSQYSWPADTGLSLGRTNSKTVTIGYNTTVQIPVGSMVKASVTIGADGSHALSDGVSGAYVRVQGLYGVTLQSTSGGWQYFRNRRNQHGGYLQSQVGMWDALFLTYGLRAVYNPNLGANQNPNWEPRYGAALTRELPFGITAKLSASYGTSTRPPAAGAKDPQLIIDPFFTPLYFLRYGTNVTRLANPDLVPDSQQGGDGGLDLYIGSRGSLTVRRYNQTVDHLIVEPVVDSVPLTPAGAAFFIAHGLNPAKYPLRQTENVNIGSVRNQGWELHGTTNVSVLTFEGTYSWSKSRLIGITPKYRRQFPQYVKGGTFNSIPEHTYALGVAYARAGTRVAYNLQGQGIVHTPPDGGISSKAAYYRFYSLGPRVDFPPIFTEIYQGFPIGDLNVSQRLSARIDGTLRVKNLTNSYKSDVDPLVAQAGRTTGLGLRVQF